MPPLHRLSGKDTILLLLYLPGSSPHPGTPITGRTRFLHLLFCFTQEVQPRLSRHGVECTLPAFEASEYGPFSADILQDLDTLQTLDLLAIETLPTCEPFEVLTDWNAQLYESGTAGVVERQSMARYCITPDRGIGYCETVLLPSLRPASIAWLNQFKSRCNDASLTALLRYNMTRYPQFTTNAALRTRVLKYDTLPASDSNTLACSS